MKLYRVMKVDPTDGKPLVGIRRNMLGVRPYDPNNRHSTRKFDVDAVTDAEPVLPGTLKGLSVSTEADRLHPAPDEAIWQIDEEDLSPDFVAVPDRRPHHILEPSRRVTLAEYQLALRATRDLWERVGEEGEA